jgi:hypothetical protein
MTNRMSVPIFLLAWLFLTPAMAERNLPPGAAPKTVLEAYFTDLKSVLDDAETAELGLNATYAAVDGYWIRSSRESVQQTGQVADLNSVMFFKMNRPTSWEISEPRMAGDFARAAVTFAPSASSGVVRDSAYDSIETRFDLVSQNGDWFIVGFKGPQVETPAPPPEPLAVDESDTPETLVARFMDVVVAELGPSSGPPGSGKLGEVAAKVEDMWVDTNDARRSLGQSLAMMSILQPKSWQLVGTSVNGDNAEVSVKFESGSPLAANMPASSGLQGDPTLRFSAERDDGTWRLGSVLR